MSDRRLSLHGLWSNRFVFVLAATGSTVGLGNIWKFPYTAGQNGGAAFVLVYLACILIVGIPLMSAEIFLGRTSRRSPPTAFAEIAESQGKSRHWMFIGLIGVLTGCLIMAFYSVIAGITMGYMMRAAAGTFNSLDPKGISEVWQEFVSDPEKLLGWFTLFLAITLLIIAAGVKEGLERCLKWLMPVMGVLLFVMLAYAFTHGDFDRAINFMFKPNFDAINSTVWLEALGHAFFTLSLGMGAILMYGAYLPGQSSIYRLSFAVVFFDTLVAIVAGLAVFSITFEYGLDPVSGPGLVFQSLPIAFAQMTAGHALGFLFFLLLTVAALTSAVSLLEPAVAYIVERWYLGRAAAAAVVGAGVWGVGLFALLSFNVLKDFHPVEWLPIFQGKNIFDILTYSTASVLLPIGGILTALFAGWIVKWAVVCEEFNRSSVGINLLWRIMVKFVTPAAIVLVGLKTLNLLPEDLF